MEMVSADEAVFLQHAYDGRMIGCVTFFVPNLVAIQVAAGDSGFPRNPLWIAKRDF